MPIRRSLPLVRIAALVAILAGAAFAVPAAATDRTIVVQPGDTLSEIALQHGLTVAQLLALNSIADPNRIYAGQRLRLTGQPVAPAAPAPAAPAPAPIVHVVQAGEHLTGIARRYGTTIGAIASANGITNRSYLRVGWNLSIPGTAAPAVPAEAETAAAPAAPPAPMPTTMAALVAARGDVRAILETEAAAQGVPTAFALALAWQESGWRAGVVSSAGAIGVMQLMPATADWVGSAMLGTQVNPRDAQSNVHAGIRLLQHYLDRYHGDKALALAAYYQGQTAADRHGVYPMTRPYIASILALESLFAR